MLPPSSLDRHMQPLSLPSVLAVVKATSHPNPYSCSASLLDIDDIPNVQKSGAALPTQSEGPFHSDLHRLFWLIILVKRTLIMRMEMLTWVKYLAVWSGKCVHD